MQKAKVCLEKSLAQAGSRAEQKFSRILCVLFERHTFAFYSTI